MCYGLFLLLSRSNSVNFDIYENDVKITTTKTFWAHFSVFQSAGVGSKYYFLSFKLYIAYFYEHTERFRTARKKKSKKVEKRSSLVHMCI